MVSRAEIYFICKWICLVFKMLLSMSGLFYSEIAHILMGAHLLPLFALYFFAYACFLVVTCLSGRYTVGECRLAEEAPPVVSSASPPGRLLLLPDRHAGRPGALWPLPQRCHQEEFHSVIPSRGSKSGEVLISKHCLRVSQLLEENLPASVPQTRSFSDQ